MWRRRVIDTERFVTNYVALIVVLFAACSTSPETQTPPVADTSTMLTPGSSACRAHLECALYCDGVGCEEECLASMPEGDATLVNAVLNCLTNCPEGPARGACIADQCFEPYHACYARALVGERSCASTWTCFGDCGDAPDCLNGCVESASLQGLQQFVSVEVCSDTYVTERCDAPDCDAEALSSVCRSSFETCLDSDLPAVTANMTAACEQANTCGWSESPRMVEDCILTIRRAIAGCPSADKDMLLTAQDCLAQAACTEVGWKGCPGWKTSEVCQEIVGSPSDGRWP